MQIVVFVDAKKKNRKRTTAMSSEGYEGMKKKTHSIFSWTLLMADMMELLIFREQQP